MSAETSDNYKYELEDQFILRLPQKQADQVRHALKTLKSKKFKKFLTINVDNSNKEIRDGWVKVKKQTLHAKLVDLPCMIESCKTSDKVQLFKTADVCQMLICQEEPFGLEEENVPAKICKDNGRNVNKKHLHPHGITAPMKNVRKQRFAKVLKNKENIEEAVEVEKELLWLLRADKEAVASRFELYYEQQPPVNESTLFGDLSSSSDEESPPSSTQASSSQLQSFKDPMRL